MNGHSHFQEYPKFAYNQAGDSRLVNTRAEEKTLGEGWDFGPGGTALPKPVPRTAAEAEALEAVNLLAPILETARILTPDGSDLAALTRFNEWAHEQLAFGAGSTSVGGGTRRQKAS